MDQPSLPILWDPSSNYHNMERTQVAIIIDGPQIVTADKGWSYSLGGGREGKNSSP